MARRYRGGGKNPYLPKSDQGKRYNYELVLDEAHQKWRVGSWRARQENFSLERDELTAGQEEIRRPDASRFKLDIKKDLLGDVISLKSLSELDYSPQYRPKGKLTERISDPVAPRRYDVLAGMKEAPPDDLAFLADAEARRQRGLQRDGARKIRDVRRLETPLEERRSQLMKMLPDNDEADTEHIIEESRKRRAMESAELGEETEIQSYRRRTKKRRKFDPVADEVRDEYAKYMLSDNRYKYLPEEYGMGQSTRQLPDFESQTRRWSEADSLNPSWGEIVRITDVSRPEDDGGGNEIDPREPLYRPQNTRRTLREAPVGGEIIGSFDNDYLKHSGIRPERIREIMHKEYRGRWIPPAMFNDDEMVHEYFNRRSRGDVIGEDFVTWAQRQRAMAGYLEEQRIREEELRLERLRSPAPGRRGSPYAPPAPRYEHTPDMDDYEYLRREGRRQGKQMKKEESRRQAKLQKAEQAERYRQYQQSLYSGYGNYYGGYYGQYPGLFNGQSPSYGNSGSQTDEYYPKNKKTKKSKRYL